jgi:hypothetical protein
MAHEFEQNRPDHQVHIVQLHHDDAFADEKLDKGCRSPMATELPTGSTLETPQVDLGLTDGPADPH